MYCSITLTANAGCILKIKNRCILLDALHNEKTMDFSTLSCEMTERVFDLLRNNPPEFIAVTHRHPDHYSKPLIGRAMAEFPKARLIMPQKSETVYGPDWELLCVPLKHMGSDEYNSGFLLKTRSISIFTAGDGDMKDAEVRKFCGGLRPDLALLNFPWLTTKAGREALKDLQPRELVLLHMPLEEDDRWGYNKAAKAAVEKYRPNTVLLNRFLQTVEFSL